MRNQAVSIIRVVAMIMVVFYHCLCFYTSIWNTGLNIKGYTVIATILNAIDIPAFMFLSGYLYGYLYIQQGKYRDCKQFIIAKVKRLLLPYMFWDVFYV